MGSVGLELAPVSASVASSATVADQGPVSSQVNGESFAEHLDRAFSASSPSHSTNLTKGSHGAKSASAPTSLLSAPGEQAQSAVSAPLDTASSGTEPAAAGASHAGSDVAWLTEMLPDLLAGVMSPELSAGADPRLPPGTSTGEGEPVSATPESKDAKTTSAASAAPSNSKTTLSTDEILNLNEGQTSGNGASSPTSPASSRDGSTLQSANTSAGSAADVQTKTSEASPKVAANRQSDPSVQKAVAALESMELSSVSAAASDSAGALPSSGRAAPMSKVGLSNPATTKAISSKTGDGSGSQNAGRDSGGAASGASEAEPARNDASSAAESPGSADGSGSKNNGAQGSAAHAATSPDSTGQATASTGASSASAASQAVANAVQPVLNQVSLAAGAAAHAASGTQSGTAQTTVGEKVAAAMDAPAGAPTGLVNAASLSLAQGRVEMRVALQTDGLGMLQLHAVMEGTQIGASIATVNHEARTLLANDLPALQQVLTEQNLRVERLTVAHSPTTSGSGSGDSRGSQSGDFSRPRDQAGRWFIDAATPSATPAAPEAPSGRFSVRV